MSGKCAALLAFGMVLAWDLLRPRRRLHTRHRHRLRGIRVMIDGEYEWFRSWYDYRRYLRSIGRTVVQ